MSEKLNYTEWKPKEYPSGLNIIVKGSGASIATISDGWGKVTETAHAELIVAAVNACIKVNPSNPLAVAEKIGGMVKALKMAKDALKTLLYEHPDDDIGKTQKEMIDQVLSAIENKECVK